MRHFDIAIIGAGLSGLVRADILSDSPNRNLTIAIIDPAPSTLEQKTFSSWVRMSDPPHIYSHRATHRWRSIQITGPEGERLNRTLEDHAYEIIPGRALFDEISAKLMSDSRFCWIHSSVESISDVPREHQSRLLLSSGEAITVNRIFSSALHPSGNLLQSFVGVEVLSEESRFSPESVQLMDFSVPQEGEVRFVYLLPFSDKHALIEYTAFSKRGPEDSGLELLLSDFVERTLGGASFKILRKESGAVPMDPDYEPRFPPPFHRHWSEGIGGAAGRIKPSTGYSLSRNLESAAAVQGSFFRTIRFAFYDRLLLEVVAHKGGRAAELFHRLFRDNPVDSVLLFLSEKTTVLQEMKILSRLPWKPFLIQLVAGHPFAFAIAITGILSVVFGERGLWPIPAFGLATIGMAHGSLDLVLAGRSDRLGFLGAYFARILLNIVIWVFSPLLAFFLFILQASDHFGEAQWIRLLRASGNSGAVRSRAVLWGVFASLFGVMYHWSESAPLIQDLIGPGYSISGINATLTNGIAWSLLLLGLWAAGSLDRYHHRVYGVPGTGLLSTLGLALTLMALPLLPGFFCFFAFWHGWDSMKVQLKSKKWTLGEYARRSAPYTLVANLVILGFVLFHQEMAGSSTPWRILFISISALTAAHAPAMKRFLFSVQDAPGGVKTSP